MISPTSSGAGQPDRRAEAAEYYDLNPSVPADVPFYTARVPHPDALVLELGCGTGRVLIPLANACGYIHGLDLSSAMIDICRAKLRAAAITPTRACVDVADITSFSLSERFDLIIAPYRVLQNLETDAAVAGFFECIRHHLGPGGSCILNVFKPYADPETVRREWCSDVEKFSWEVPIGGGRVTCHDRRPRMDRDKMILYPELIYRQYLGQQLLHEVTLKIAMRCYYPEAFEELIVQHGFKLLGKWGGYAGEPYGEGPELVVQFTRSYWTAYHAI